MSDKTVDILLSKLDYQTLRLGPEDALILRSKEPLSRDAQALLARRLQSAFPTTTLMLLDGLDVELEVIKGDEDAFKSKIRSVILEVMGEMMGGLEMY